MKQIASVSILVSAALFCGCTTPRHQAPDQATAGSLAVKVPSLLGLQGNLTDARIYIDGRFVGNYDPDQTVLNLSPGQHTVRVHVPRGVERREAADGGVVVRQYALEGEERIEVLGADSRQSLVFNGDNLKSTQLKDEDGQ